MKETVKVKFVPWRFYLLIGLVAVGVLGLALRIFDLAILKQKFLRQQGDERVLRLVTTPAFRGIITDRFGSPLAVSTLVYSVWVNPQEISINNKDIRFLAQVLKISPKVLSQTLKLTQEKKREFVYLKRGIEPELAKQIKAAKITGVYLQPEYKRYYPEGEVSAHVVGITNIDDRGQEGLELAYDPWLSGTPGKAWTIKDRAGRIISQFKIESEQQPGKDIALSIDRRIQFLAYRELAKAVDENAATSGSAVVLDTKTGEVLAMVNQPAYNPNKREGRIIKAMRNRAITDIFEPGSTIKAFTIAAALESGRYQPNSIIDTTPGWMRVGHNIVKDERNNAELSIAQILQISSNMGAAKIVLSLPPDSLWNLLHKVGFGEPTGVIFPGEQMGSLIKHEPWGSFMLATLSFGYGMSATTLQLARAYSVFAAGGILRPSSLLKLEQIPAGERVVSEKTAQQMLTLLENVVVGKRGTGSAAKIAGYRVAGKTGTSKIAGNGGYQKRHYISSFVGIAPLSNPRLVVAVVINDPQGKAYYGGDVSAPAFAKIMEGALRILNIAPDAKS